LRQDEPRPSGPMNQSARPVAVRNDRWQAETGQAYVSIDLVLSIHVSSGVDTRRSMTSEALPSGQRSRGPRLLSREPDVVATIVSVPSRPIRSLQVWPAVGIGRDHPIGVAVLQVLLLANPGAPDRGSGYCDKEKHLPD
jgi:hypothetical protein